jgi:hypothetical protein
MKARGTFFLWIIMFVLAHDVFIYADESLAPNEDAYHENSDYKFITLLLHGWSGGSAPVPGTIFLDKILSKYDGLTFQGFIERERTGSWRRFREPAIT